MEILDATTVLANQGQKVLRASLTFGSVLQDLAQGQWVIRPLSPVPAETTFRTAENILNIPCKSHLIVVTEQGPGLLILD